MNSRWTRIGNGSGFRSQKTRVGRGPEGVRQIKYRERDTKTSGARRLPAQVAKNVTLKVARSVTRFTDCVTNRGAIEILHP